MNPPRWVLDTNVVLDCLYFDDALARPLWHAVTTGTANCLADAATLDELRRVLAYRQFALTPAQQARILADYRTQVRPCAAQADSPLPRCRDAADQKFLQLAHAARADLLISKDRDLLKLRRNRTLGFRIVTPAEVELPD